MVDVYVCVTLYHVYVTLIDIYSLKKDKNKLIILLNANNKQIYSQFQFIYNQLLRENIRCSLRLRSKKREILGLEKVSNYKQLNFVKEVMAQTDSTNFTLYNFAWNNSYAYSTVNLLYKCCTKAIFMEESTIIAKLPKEKFWKRLIYRISGGIVDFFEDEKLEEIRVQRPELFPNEWKKKLHKLDIDGMLQVLGENEKGKILEIMSKDSGKILELLKENSVGIAFSSPFSEDKLITEQEKIFYTKKMCDYYKRYGQVIVKLHPRDTTNYHFDDDVPVLSSSFPSELLSLIGYKFKFAIAICSSAVDTANAEYKINMNENFLRDKKFVLKDITGNLVN